MEHSAFLKKIVPAVTRSSLGLLFGSLIIGQIIRFTIVGQGGGLLLSDIASALVVVLGFLLVLLGVERKHGLHVLFALLAVTPFLLWSIFVVLTRSGYLGYEHTSIAVLYWIRLAVILLIYPAGIAIIKTKHIQEYTKQVFIYTYIALLLLGFLQLIFFPTGESFGHGWDPHHYRMVATWLDPNFFGAFIAIGLPAVVVWLRSSASRTVFFVLACIAIVLTKSRSTYIATAIALYVCGIVWLFSASLSKQWKKVFIPGVVILFIVMSFAGVVLQERATQIFLHDPTITLRLDAYSAVWERIIEPNIFFGIGYNAYQFAAQDAGLISNSLIHSRSGSDSSILTLLATTGLIGTALFLIPIFLHLVWHRSFLFLWATVLLLVHCQFENSLLYPHLVIPYIFIALLAI